MEIYVGSEGLSNVIKNKETIEKLNSDNTTTFQSIENKINENQNSVESKLLQKVDVNTLENNYSNNESLKKQLLEKANKTDLETAIQKRLEDFQSLLNSISETEAKIDANYESLMSSVNEVKDSLFAKIQDLTNVMNSTSTELTSKITDVTDNVNSAKQNLIQSDINLNEKITAIDTKIPSTASATNQLVDKNYVDDLVLNNSANAITSNVDGSSFASLEALKAGPWYSLGVEIHPSKNDYAIVKSDTLHNENDVRYLFDGNGWIFFQEFKQGTKFELTANQALAVNSGITSDLVNQITTNKNNLEAEITQRTSDKSDLLSAISNEGNYRLENDNSILQQLALEQNTRETKDLEILTKISEHEKTTSVEHNAIKKIVSDNKSEIEATIGTISNLNTDVKTSVVDCINDLHDEMHNERVAKTGDTMTGKLSFQLTGTGTPLSLTVSDTEGNVKGVDLTIDATSGFMNMIPKSRDDLGFEVSALSFSPRNPSDTLPFTLGTDQKKWSNIYVKKINDVDVFSRIDEVEINSQTKDNEILQQIQNEIDNRDLADQNLQINITAEETARKADDLAINDSIGDKTTLKTSKTDTIVDAINSLYDSKVEIDPLGIQVLNFMYPIGSIYISLNSGFNPNTAWQGTKWEKLANGLFLEANATPGSVKNPGLPDIYAHWGNIQGGQGGLNASGAGWISNTGNASWSGNTWGLGYIYFQASRYNGIYGRSATVQPYSITVIMWKRTG